MTSKRSLQKQIEEFKKKLNTAEEPQTAIQAADREAIRTLLEAKYEHYNDIEGRLDGTPEERELFLESILPKLSETERENIQNLM